MNYDSLCRNFELQPDSTTAPEAAPGDDDDGAGGALCARFECWGRVCLTFCIALFVVVSNLPADRQYAEGEGDKQMSGFAF